MISPSFQEVISQRVNPNWTPVYFFYIVKNWYNVKINILFIIFFFLMK